MIYGCIPTTIVHRPIQLLDTDETSAEARERSFFPTSTIRQTCKFIARVRLEAGVDSTREGPSKSKVMWDEEKLVFLSHDRQIM
ncbi:hypothetical protein HBI29_155020 [Parastagonospora nodorum]|nr:hypothetical protein HBI29_155020 [Parastagonospora nodorum]